VLSGALEGIGEESGQVGGGGGGVVRGVEVFGRVGVEEKVASCARRRSVQEKENRGGGSQVREDLIVVLLEPKVPRGKLGYVVRVGFGL